MSDRLTICDYFNELVDEVDLRAERLLDNYKLDHKDQLGKLINERRTKFIDTIEELKTHNLERLNDKVHQQSCDQGKGKEAIFDKYCFILDEIRLKMKDSEPVDDKLNHINETFGYLIVLEDGGLSERNLALFKEMVSINYAVANCDLSKESNVFNAILNDVIVRKIYILIIIFSIISIIWTYF